MKKTVSILLLFLYMLSLTAQDKSIQDSLFFIKTKAEFLKFEQEHGHYIQTNNVKMHYLTWGKPSGTPIVWAHGTGSDAYEMLGFADSLVKKGCYVISIDYYGHGFTPIPEKEVSLYHVADDIKLLLDHLKIKKAVLGGWSRGGSVATAFYDAYPDRVLGIILEDGGSVAWASNDHKESMDSFTVKMTNMFTEYEAFQKLTFESEFKASRQWAEGDAYNQKHIFQVLASVKKNAVGKWVFNPGLMELCGVNSVEEFLTLTYRPFASDKLFGASNSLLFPKVIYRNLDVPLLILDPVSDKDQFVFEEENAKLQKAHPDLITHKVYKETSHALKYERSDAFLKDVILFLATVKKLNKK
jgi:pimeloyl-ACP methyl ester carboxylesterase